MISKRTFTRKGYGRIYVLNEEDIPRVKELALIIDRDEFEGYAPKELITPFSKYPEVVYMGKFDDFDLDFLEAACMAEGIAIFCFDSRHDEFPENQMEQVPWLYQNTNPRFNPTTGTNPKAS